VLVFFGWSQESIVLGFLLSPGLDILTVPHSTLTETDERWITINYKANQTFIWLITNDKIKTIIWKAIIYYEKWVKHFPSHFQLFWTESGPSKILAAQSKSHIEYTKYEILLLHGMKDDGIQATLKNYKIMNDVLEKEVCHPMPWLLCIHFWNTFSFQFSGWDIVHPGSKLGGQCPPVSPCSDATGCKDFEFPFRVQVFF